MNVCVEYETTAVVRDFPCLMIGNRGGIYLITGLGEDKNERSYDTFYRGFCLVSADDTEVGDYLPNMYGLNLFAGKVTLEN